MPPGTWWNIFYYKTKPERHGTFLGISTWYRPTRPMFEAVFQKEARSRPAQGLRHPFRDLYGGSEGCVGRWAGVPFWGASLRGSFKRLVFTPGTQSQLGFMETQRVKHPSLGGSSDAQVVVRFDLNSMP